VCLDLSRTCFVTHTHYTKHIHDIFDVHDSICVCVCVCVLHRFTTADVRVSTCCLSVRACIQMTQNIHMTYLTSMVPCVCVCVCVCGLHHVHRHSAAYIHTFCVLILCKDMVVREDTHTRTHGSTKLNKTKQGHMAQQSSTKQNKDTWLNKAQQNKTRTHCSTKLNKTKQGHTD
jgi:hypothetical protein